MQVEVWQSQYPVLQTDSRIRSAPPPYSGARIASNPKCVMDILPSKNRNMTHENDSHVI